MEKTFTTISQLASLATICFLAGCGTPFNYTPKHEQTYPVSADQGGLEIAGGIDARPDDEKLPEWSKNVEVIVARALADEVQHTGLFKRVKIHLSGPARLNKFSYYVEFRVEAFEMVPQTGTAERIGRTALDALGWRGALISASIPATWESQVKVRFEVFDAGTRQTVFARSYVGDRTLSANGYQGKSRQIQQTSDCLEAVVQQFVGDLSRLPAAKGSRSAP